MNTSTARSSRRPHRRSSAIESLEPRRLMSGTWSTVDTIPSNFEASVNGMAADKMGNVYAVGYKADLNAGHTLYLREKPVSSATWTTVVAMNGGQWGKFSGVAVDAAGDVFVTGENSSNYFATWELPKGVTTLKQIDADTVASGVGNGVSVDPSGNVYAVGFDRTKYKGGTALKWTVRKGTFAGGKWSFSTVDQQLQSVGEAYAVTVAPTGVYVTGYYNNNWTIRKSATGATGTWATVDTSSGGSAQGVATDAAGDIYVVGQLPISNINNWIVRESTNGGSSWTTVDNLGGNFSFASAFAITRDASGSMVVAGYAVDSTGEYAVVRTNAGGNWANLDSYSSPGGTRYFAVAADSLGNLYAGGQDFDDAGNEYWIIRSQPAASKNLAAIADATSPTSQINLSWANTAGAEASGFEIFRSTDGVNFSAIGTTDASTTTFADDTVSSGTTYYYYVVTLLNTDGSSNPSNTAIAST